MSDPENEDVPSSPEAVIAATVVFLTVVVFSTLAWGVWMAYRTAHPRVFKPKKRRPAKRHRCYVPESNTLEMGHSFTKSESCDWELAASPHFRPHDSDLTAYLPTFPQRAVFSDWAPYPPCHPDLPPCQTLDIAKSPMMVANSKEHLCGVRVVFDKYDQNSPRLERQVQVPLTPPSDFIDLERVTGLARDFSRPRVGLGLALCDVPMTMDAIIAGDKTPTHAQLLQGRTRVMEGYSEDNPPNYGPSHSPAAPLQLPSPIVTPTLPKYVLTAAPSKHALVVEGGTLSAAVRLPTPLATPTLVVTSPSTHHDLGLSDKGDVERNGDSELESWSDILGLEEYEEDPLDGASTRPLDDFPSPPGTPTRLSTSIASTCQKEQTLITTSRPCAIAPDPRFACEEYATQFEESKDEVAPEDVHFDYVAFRERLAALTRDMEEQERIASILSGDDTTGKASTNENIPRSTSSGTDFNHGRVLARKRSPSVLSGVPPPNQDISRRSAPRPLPLPAEFQPMLSRGVERSKLKPRV